MRIVKLSDQETRFDTLDGVKRFFSEGIRHRTPPGKFQVTPRRIAQDGLNPGEPLIFTYKARVVFTARAGGGLVPNHDDEHQIYPHYFVVDLATLREADEDFHNVRRWYKDATGADVAGQGWSRLPDSVHTKALWARLREAGNVTLPEEIVEPAGLIEGALCVITVNAYERNPEARRRCIERHGTSCRICGFNFGSVYGEVAEGYIHVHHLRQLSEVGGEYVVDPVEDLRPVCPNCHAVVHGRSPAHSIEEVRGFLRTTRSA